MESLFDENLSLWGHTGEVALPWSDGGLLEDLEWLSKPGRGLVDGNKPQAEQVEDLWDPLVDLVDDVDLEDWMEITMDAGDFGMFTSSLPESVDPFAPTLAPSLPQEELLGKMEKAEAEILPVIVVDDTLTVVTSECAKLFSAMLDTSATSSTTSLNSMASPERPSSRDSSFSADGSCIDSFSEPPSSVEPGDMSHWLSTANESSSESTSNARRSSSSRKSPRASSLRSKSSKAREPGEKRVRKRDQNRDAATRYREKKKAEADTLRIEEERLERKNHELRDRVDGLSSEIKYLKSLMKELLVARQK